MRRNQRKLQIRKYTVALLSAVAVGAQAVDPDTSFCTHCGCTTPNSPCSGVTGATADPAPTI